MIPRYLYTLLFVFFTGLFCTLYAQARKPGYFTLGFGAQITNLETEYQFNIIQNGQDSKSSEFPIQSTVSPNVSLGYIYQKKDRVQWHMQLSVTGGKSKDEYEHYRLQFIDVPHSTSSNREYLTINGDFVFSYRLGHSWRHTRTFIGTGLTYAIIYQSYDSGYAYNRTLRQMEASRRTKEWRDVVGLPFRIRTQRFIDHRITAGLLFQTNIYLSSEMAMQLQGFLAYRLF